MRKEISYQFVHGQGLAPSAASKDVEIVNMYHVRTPSGRSEVSLCDVQGSTIAATVSSSFAPGCRGLWSSSTGPNNKAMVYGVFGNALFRFDGTTAVEVGRVVGSSRRVSFAENQDQTKSNTRGFLCDGYFLYSWDLKASDASIASTFREVQLPYVNGSETERAAASYVTYSNFRLVVTCSNSLQWYYSDLNSEVFQALNFESAESNPDSTARVIEFGNNLWALGRFSFDIFSPTGISNNPFDVAGGASGRIGCASGDSVATYADSMLWLGQGENSNSAVFMASPNGLVKRVSDNGIERLLDKWEARSRAFGFFVTLGGQPFYCITSKIDRQTFAYSLETGLWCQFATSENGALKYWDVAGAVASDGGALYFAPLDQNRLCVFDDAKRTDYQGRKIPRYWQGPVFTGGGNRFVLAELGLDMEAGTAYSLTEEPQLYAMASFDGGRTFGQRVLRGFGKAGEYGKRVRFNALGSGYALVLRIGTSSDAPFVLYQLKMIIDIAGRG